MESARDAGVEIFFGIDENRIQLAVEPMHIMPGRALEKTVLGKNSNVLRKIGVIDAAGLQIKHLPCKQSRQTDRSGRADNNLGKFFPLDIIEDLKNRWEA